MTRPRSTTRGGSITGKWGCYDMARASFKITFDKRAVKARVNGANKNAIPIVAQEALKDANALARRQSGELVESSLNNSDLEHGKLVWQTKYARRMYYTGVPRKNKNPRAVLMWAHRGAQANLPKYIRMMNALAKGGGG